METFSKQSNQGRLFTPKKTNWIIPQLIQTHSKKPLDKPKAF
jgi:hypothetical protein